MDLICSRYVKDNPPTPLICRVFQKCAVHRGADYRYHADFNGIFPESKVGDFVWLFTLYAADCAAVLTMAVNSHSPVEIFVNGQCAYKSDTFSERDDVQKIVTANVHAGLNDISIRFEKTLLGFGGSFGTHVGKWDYIFLNPLESEREGVLWGNLNENGGTLYPPLTYPQKKALPTVLPTDEAFWKTPCEDTFLRPYYGGGLFGKWNYPLGVTLRGLMRTALLHKDNELKAYVKAHFERVINTFEYALFDKERYGGATAVHNLLSGIDSLDDCGSMGATLLEAARTMNIEGSERIAAYVDDYITNKQSRRPEGCFWRQKQLHAVQNETLWADDLYMGTSFLCERYIQSGDTRYAADAFNQFLSYKKYLYIPRLKVFSHVYDFRHNAANGIPWGRANGWVLYSLCDLLCAAPDAPRELYTLFYDLCEGVSALQSEDGRWHQVLCEKETYLETSCTAMFIYAFFKAARHGILKDEKYTDSAKRAWKSLEENAIEGGNVLGVCRGSEFSFSTNYYANLSTNINDTHGVGIVLMARCEAERVGCIC